MSIESLRASLADRYTIERELGAGGMATVYLAQDLKHDRKVAIKVLRPELAAVIGAERFLSEIKTTANLQHPHILPLFDSGEVRLRHPERSDPEGSGVEGPRSFLFYVMPFVEGETLRDRLARETQLGIPDAVRITTEVGQALDYAHRHGVIHRDIKPENILLHDGRALVADFGIALAATTAGSRMTETGMSLGTPHYMSPEQAMGERDLDARSDIYALGCICYEMLTGAPPFDGPTAQSIVAKVMTERPTAPSVTRDTVPEQVEDAVMMALAKLPVDRFATAAEFVAALGGGGGPHRTTRQRAASLPVGPWRRVSMGLGAAVLALGGVAGWALTRQEPAGPRVFDAGLPDSAPIDFSGQTPSSAYGSPLRKLDLAESGEFVVYLARVGATTEIWRRDLTDATMTPIAGTTGADLPRIAPDGKRLAFVSIEGVMLVDVAGGAPRRIGDADDTIESLEWVSPTRLTWIGAEAGQLRWIDTEAGVVRVDSIPRCIDGSWVAGGTLLLCSRGGGGAVLDPSTAQATTIRIRNDDGSAGPVLAGDSFRDVDGAYLVYVAPDGDLRAAPYDPATALVGRSVTVGTGIRQEGIGVAQLDFNVAGALVFAPGQSGGGGRLVRLTRGGSPEPLAMPVGGYQRWDLSRDGRWLAAVVTVSGQDELAIHDLRDGRSFTWLTADGIDSPYWAPDGGTLLVGVINSAGAALVSGSPFSATPPDTILVSDTRENRLRLTQYVDRTTVLGALGPAADQSIQFDPTVRPVRLDTLSVDPIWLTASPDKRHLAYFVADGNRLLTTTYPPSTTRHQVASQAVEPIWLSPTELLYRSGITWFVATIDNTTGEPVGTPVEWNRDLRFSDTYGWSNRPDWQGGIIYLQGLGATSASYLRVVPHWASEMKAAVDEANR